MRIIILIFLIFSNLSFAKENEFNKQEACSLYEKTAEIVMKYRQSGAPMSELYNKDFGDKDKNIIIKGMLVEAYSTPKYYSERVIQNEINEFRNKKLLECIKNIR